MPADHELCRTCTHRCAPSITNAPDAPPECEVELERGDVAAWLAGYFAEDVACPGHAETVPAALAGMAARGEQPVVAEENAPPDIKLSPDQEAACTAILDGLKSRANRSLVLVGPAGTGKTTLVRELVRRIRATDGREVAFAAPTGKAALRLRESTGEQTATVHSLIYGKPENRGRCPAYFADGSREAEEDRDAWHDGLPVCGAWSRDLAVSRLEMRARGLDHRTCPSCKREFAPDVEIKVKLCFEKKQGNAQDAELASDAILVVDEASMVNDSLHGDTLNALPCVTILYVGDREQLPPVEGRWGPDFDNPTAALTRIHRQALDNPIIAVATKLRTTEDKYPFSKYDNDSAGRFYVGDGSVDGAARWLADAREKGADATLITYTNNMRRALNARVRDYRGLVRLSEARQLPIVEGDRLLVLSNNRVTGHANGEVCVVEESAWAEPAKLIGPNEVVSVKLVGRPERMLIPMVAFGEDRREFTAYRQSHVNAWDASIKRDPSGENARSLNLVDPALFLHCDFGECLTCHKSQGSQWADVGVVWDRSLWGMWFNDTPTGRRWAYTAVTRAAKTLRVWYVK